MTEILTVRSVSKYFHYPRPLLARFWTRPNAEQSLVKAVDDVSFVLRQGAIFAILGESGSGKTTLVRTILGLTEPSHGEVFFKGENIFDFTAAELKQKVRAKMRMIFQHPDAVLNPAFTVRMVLQQALDLYADREADGHEEEMTSRLAEVGLSTDYLRKYAHELSGGEKRRIGICRALLTNPEIIFADELISGLDVFLQQQILGLFLEIREQKRLSTIYISHDVGLVHQVASDIAIMFRGQFVEMGRREDISGKDSLPALRPEVCHPYTQELISCHLALHSSAGGGKPIVALNGNHHSDNLNGGGGCAYRQRCVLCDKSAEHAICAEKIPELVEIEKDHFVACHLLCQQDKGVKP